MIALLHSYMADPPADGAKPTDGAKPEAKADPKAAGAKPDDAKPAEGVPAGKIPLKDPRFDDRIGLKDVLMQEDKE